MKLNDLVNSATRRGTRRDDISMPAVSFTDTSVLATIHSLNMTLRAPAPDTVKEPRAATSPRAASFPKSRSTTVPYLMGIREHRSGRLPNMPERAVAAVWFTVFCWRPTRPPADHGGKSSPRSTSANSGVPRMGSSNGSVFNCASPVSRSLAAVFSHTSALLSSPHCAYVSA